MFRIPCIAMVLASMLVSGCSLEKPGSVSANPEIKQPEEKASGLLSHILPAPAKLPEGTPVSVRLLHTVSSRTSKPGDEFDAELSAPLAVEGETLFAKGARVRGRVVTAKESGRLKDPGHLSLTLDAVQTADGRWVPLETTSVAAKGESHTKRNTTLIGGGAGTGALIGAIAGGGKGAAIGAGVGAGAGTAGAYATGKKDVSFQPEAKLNFKTTREVVVN